MWGATCKFIHKCGMHIQAMKLTLFALAQERDDHFVFNIHVKWHEIMTTYFQNFIVMESAGTISTPTAKHVKEM